MPESWGGLEGLKDAIRQEEVEGTRGLQGLKAEVGAQLYSGFKRLDNRGTRTAAGGQGGGDERGPMRSDSKGSLLRACAAPALHLEDSMEVAAGGV